MFNQADYQSKNAGNTAREIAQQPAVWRALADALARRKDEIAAFMANHSGLRTVFTGAGSSAFVGEAMQMLLNRELGLRAEAVHTTDIVATPDSVLFDTPTLLVSYSRSGESPESVGALRYAAKKINGLSNLVLVCKEYSSVARYAAGSAETLVLNMPPESCDLGFAMTSSVSCMALATWCAFGHKEFDQRLAHVRALADTVEKHFDAVCGKARQLATMDFDRLVYLGSGALRGLAREGAVKMLELTAGAVHAGWDTPTGFRHGPKSVINERTMTVHFISPLVFTRQYDRDVLDEIRRQQKGNLVIDVMPDEESEISAYIMGLLFTQLFAMEKSVVLGCNTDSPFAGTGDVNRVVKGVKIYEL